MKNISILHALVIAGSLISACGESNGNKNRNGDDSYETSLRQSFDNQSGELYSNPQYSEQAPQYNQTDSSLPFFVILGGNWSCRREGYVVGQKSPFKTLIAQEFEQSFAQFQQQTGTRPGYLLGCYGISRKVYYATSSDNEIKTSGERELLNVILSETFPGQKIIIVGHSYGGWLSMELAADLLGQRALIGLFTLDPISALECRAGKFAGCKRAPEDIGPATRAEISQASAYWANFYQTRTNLLHSGPIAEADSNIELPKAQHFSLPSQEIIWQEVFSLAVSSLGASPTF